MSFGAITPILRIFDETKAKEFYVDFLGCRVDFEHRFEPNAPLYMQVSLGACRFYLSEHHGDACPGASFRIATDELDRYQQALLDKDYKYYRPSITETEWNTREMLVQDPFGNRLIFFAEKPKS